MNKISIVIVTYNRLELLKKCLKKALSQKLADVIVINNASTDETENYIKLEIRDTIVVIKFTLDSTQFMFFLFFLISFLSLTFL